MQGGQRQVSVLLQADCRALTPPVLPVVLQEVEGQYKEGTVKHAITKVLIAVRPDALTAQGE